MKDIDSFIKSKIKPIPTVKPNGWFTIKELKERSGMTREFIRVKINDGVRSKEIDVMEIILEGRKMKCYREKKT